MQLPALATALTRAGIQLPALATALTRAGIQLPAMDIRTPWADDRKDDRERETPYALVHLGVCSAPVAHALADVITKGVAG
ncbi:hypothetical protein ABT115_28805 [Streptomyces sp. NPDC001832]|uniref:hypothetical protein n=1 Tax=Streptomyces sp. NPDC001832 TaxID=3154527 RepID=UPI003327C0E7